MHRTRTACWRARERLGRRIAITTAMIATTISSSTIVNARELASLRGIFPLAPRSLT